MEVFPEKLVLLEESWRSCVFASYTRRELLSRIVLNKDAAPVFRPAPDGVPLARLRSLTPPCPDPSERLLVRSGESLSVGEFALHSLTHGRPQGVERGQVAGVGRGNFNVLIAV